MIWLKSCPRCLGGDIKLDKDNGGWYIFRLQCGFTRDMENPSNARSLALDLDVDPKRRSTLSEFFQEGCDYAPQ